MCSRLLLFAVSAIVALHMHVSPIDVWRQWDGWWYIGIAEHGYTWSFHGHSALAFFPLLPLLLHGLGQAGIPSTLDGLLVANAAFFGALLYLHALVQPVAGTRVARRAVWLLTFFPTAFFTFAPYTESLFLLAAAGSFYHARRHEVPLTGLWIAVALATRSTGIILFVPVMFLLLRARGENTRAHPYIECEDLRDRWPGWATAIRTPGAPAAWVIGPSLAAALIYASYLGSHGIALSAVIGAQRSWHRGLTWPWTGFVQSIAWPFYHVHALWPSIVETVISLVLVVSLLYVTYKAWSWLDWPERSYTVGFWLLVLCTPEWRDNYFAPFSSVDRFVLVLFPLAWWASARLSDQQWRRVMVLEGTAMAAVAGAFLAGTWIG